MVNFPVFFTSAVASCTKPSTSPATDFLSKPVLSTKAAVMLLFGIAATAFFFITFMAFTIAEESVKENTKVLVLLATLTF